MNPVVEIDITPAQATLRNFYDAAQRLPSLTKTAFNRTTQRYTKRVKARLSNEPGPPSRPIQWVSLSQKIAVLIKLRQAGMMNGYERTHELSTGWVIIRNFKDYEGSLSAANDVPYVVFVQGERAQPFHIDRWAQISTVIAEESVVAEEMYLQTWHTVIDDFGGVR